MYTATTSTNINTLSLDIPSLTPFHPQTAKPPPTSRHREPDPSPVNAVEKTLSLNAMTF